MPVQTGQNISLRRFLPATVFQLNANRGVVKAVAPRQALIPACQASSCSGTSARCAVYRCIAVVPQGPDNATDLLIGQCRQRAIKIICGVVITSTLMRGYAACAWRRVSSCIPLSRQCLFRLHTLPITERRDQPEDSSHRRVFTAVPLTLPSAYCRFARPFRSRYQYRRRIGPQRPRLGA